ncbi:DUF3576 domain-containing protein [Ferrovibrio sp.]|uniref:DUF3576 domain-containing protein n=1 Tax=Ferrovibrio sp. TaxID=1917215 RepID=UPI00311FC6DA
MAALRPISLRFRLPVLPACAAAALLLGLAGCTAPDDGETKTYFPEKNQYGTYDPAPQNERQTVFGGGGLNILGSGNKKPEQGGGGGIGVNSFLWRASLDTIAFMPLASADPFGGVIITDWYTPPQTPNERLKVTVYILDRALRADGLRVSVFRQARQGDTWIDQPTTPNTAANMENAILQRAREFRMETEARR